MALPFTVGLFHDGVRPAVSRHRVRKRIADAKLILFFEDQKTSLYVSQLVFFPRVITSSLKKKYVWKQLKETFFLGYTPLGLKNLVNNFPISLLSVVVLNRFPSGLLSALVLGRLFTPVDDLSQVHPHSALSPLCPSITAVGHAPRRTPPKTSRD